MNDNNYQAPAIFDMDDDAEFAVAPGQIRPSSRWEEK
jgi:hypothetical protein